MIETQNPRSQTTDELLVFVKSILSLASANEFILVDTLGIVTMAHSKNHRLGHSVQVTL